MSDPVAGVPAVIDPRILHMMRQLKKRRQTQRQLDIRARRRREAARIPDVLPRTLKVLIGVGSALLAYTLTGLYYLVLTQSTWGGGPRLRPLWLALSAGTGLLILGLTYVAATRFTRRMMDPDGKRSRRDMWSEAIYLLCVTTGTLSGVAVVVAACLAAPAIAIPYLGPIVILFPLAGFLVAVFVAWCGEALVFSLFEVDEEVSEEPGVPVKPMDRGDLAHELAILRFVAGELEGKLAAEPGKAWVWQAKGKVARFAASSLVRELAEDVAPVSLDEEEKALIRESHPLLQEVHATEELSQLSMHHEWYESHLKRLHKFLIDANTRTEG